MERDGYESDRNRLCVMDLKSGEKTYVTEAFQSGVDDYCWAPDGKTLYFVGVWHATSMVHSTNLKGAFLFASSSVRSWFNWPRV